MSEEYPDQRWIDLITKISKKHSNETKRFEITENNIEDVDSNIHKNIPGSINLFPVGYIINIPKNVPVPAFVLKMGRFITKEEYWMRKVNTYLPIFSIALACLAIVISICT